MGVQLKALMKHYYYDKKRFLFFFVKDYFDSILLLSYRRFIIYHVEISIF